MDLDDLSLWADLHEQPPLPSGFSRQSTEARGSQGMGGWHQQQPDCDLNDLLADLDTGYQSACSTPSQCSTSRNSKEYKSPMSNYLSPKTTPQLGYLSARQSPSVGHPVARQSPSMGYCSARHSPGSVGLAAAQSCKLPFGSEKLGSPYGSPHHTPQYGYASRPMMAPPDDDLLSELLPGLFEEEELSGRRDRCCRHGLRREDPTPSPRNDHRGPIEDDYDVVSAIADFDGMPASPRRRRKEILEVSIRQLKSQAERLWLPSLSVDETGESPRSREDPLRSTTLNVRSHYIRVRQNLLAEARSLELQRKDQDAQDV